MKLPEVLKAAVIEQDWNKVCTVYTTITGEPLSPPAKTEAEMLADIDIPYEEARMAEEVAQQPSGNPNIKTRKGPMQKVSGGNLFHDDGSEFVDEMQDPAKKQNYKMKPRRPPSKLVAMRCTQCGSEQEISASLAAGYTTDVNSEKEQRALFRCNSCSRSQSPGGS